MVFTLQVNADWQPSSGTMTEPLELMNACSSTLVPILEMRQQCEKLVKINVLRSYNESRKGIETMREIKISLPGSECQLTIYKNLGTTGSVNKPGLVPQIPVGEILGEMFPRWDEFKFDRETLDDCKIENRQKILSAKAKDNNVIEVNRDNAQQVKPMMPIDLYNMMVNPYVSDVFGGLVIFSDSDKKEVIGFVRPTGGYWGWFTRWGVRIIPPKKP